MAKTEPDEIQAFCRVCGNDEAAIHSWHETEWTNGMMEAVLIDFDGPDNERDPAQPGSGSPQSSTAN